MANDKTWTWQISAGAEEIFTPLQLAKNSVTAPISQEGRKSVMHFFVIYRKQTLLLAVNHI